MQRKRFLEEQIMRILHETETLDNVREVYRQHRIAEDLMGLCAYGHALARAFAAPALDLPTDGLERGGEPCQALLQVAPAC